MITGARVDLRHVRRDDLETVTRLANDAAVRGEFLPARVMPLRRIEQRFEEDGLVGGDSEHWLAVDKEDRPVGSIWHNRCSPYDGREIGYISLRPELRGQGLITEAVCLLTDYLFRSLQINRVEICMSVGNIASERVAQKAGYILEGTRRGANFVHGRFHDMHLYAMLRSEWEARGRQLAAQRVDKG